MSASEYGRIVPYYGPRHSRRIHLAKTVKGKTVTACGRRYQRFWLSAGRSMTCEACREAAREHGTRACYLSGCRCTSCRAASTLYHRRDRGR